MIVLKKLKKLNILLVFSLLLTCLSGCNEVSDTSDDRLIVLNEPVNVASNYETVSYRDLYKTTLFTSVVSPYVEEYSFTKDQVFKSYEAVPGQNVARGETLIYARTRQSEIDIENISESIDELMLNHTVEAEHYKTDHDVAVDNQNKAGKFGGAESAKLNRDRLEESYRQGNARYDLELQYLKDKKALLEKQSMDANIKSGIDGTVVNCAIIYGAEEVQKDIPIIAVGDLNKKLLKCEYISRATISKADDIYAFINGKRYELINESIETEEYNILKNSGETVYSSFAIIDENDEVKLGDFAVIVLVKESRKDVLCIPNDAVKKENDIYYVYTMDGENTTYVEVEVGMRDGFYAEILSGLKEGDKVLTNSGVKKGKNTATLEIGECSTETEISGTLFYPFSQWLLSPMDSGTAYIKEIYVSEYEQVKKGQKILSLEVNTDDVEIERCEARINRINQRILDEVQRQKEIDELNEKIDEPEKKWKDRNIEKDIISYQKDLITEEAKLKKLKRYSGIIDITAPADGIILDEGSLKVGDLVNKDTRIMQFADISKSYIVLRDKNAVLNYGEDVEINFTSGSERVSIPGKVVTVSNTSLSKKMAKDWALVDVDAETKQELIGTSEGNGGAWSINMFKVKVATRKMDNVVLVPKAAVQTNNGDTYVRVINSDGSVMLKNFISGGSNNNYHFAIEGLSEGMNICWD